MDVKNIIKRIKKIKEYVRQLDFYDKPLLEQIEYKLPKRKELHK